MGTYPPQSVVAISIALPLLAVVAVCFRFYVRLYVKPTYVGIDDWLIIAAVVLSLADGANLAVAAILGIQGRDQSGFIPPERARVEAISDYVQVIIEKPLYGLVKLSVLFFFRRIFLVQKRFRIFNNFMIVLTVAWTIAFTFAVAFDCGPRPEIHYVGTCVKIAYVDLAFSITDSIGDILVVSMPYPCIRKLNISRREKWGLASIFLLGTLSTIASLIRLAFVCKSVIEVHQGVAKAHSDDTPPGVWSTVEASVGVLSACLPPLGPLIRKTPGPQKASATVHKRLFSLRQKVSGTFGSSGNNGSSGNTATAKSTTDVEPQLRTFYADSVPAVPGGDFMHV